MDDSFVAGYNKALYDFSERMKCVAKKWWSSNCICVFNIDDVVKELEIKEIGNDKD